MAELPKTSAASNKLAWRLKVINNFLTGPRHQAFKNILDEMPESSSASALTVDGKTFYTADVAYLSSRVQDINKLISEEMLVDDRQARAIDLVVEALVSPPSAS